MIIRKLQTEIQPKKKVAAYCRVSTKKEAQLGSYEEQLAVYETLIRSNEEWEFAGIYADPGLSGTSARKRPEFMRLMDEARRKKIDIILCKSISRFARNAMECQKIVEQLKILNVMVIFEENNIRSSDPGTSFVFSLMSSVAQDESHSNSENVKWSIHNRFSEGKYNLGSNRILGYDTIGEKLVPNEDAALVREIFEMFLKGKSYRQISLELADRGATTMRNRETFSPGTIQRILTNETYVGDKLLQKQAPVDYLTKRPDPNVNYESFYISEDHEPIIDRGTWEQVKTIFDQRREAADSGVCLRSGNHHFLYGKVFCAACGAPFKRRTLRGGKKNGTPEMYKAWNCKERQKGKAGNGCRNAVIREERLLEQISQSLCWEWHGAEAFPSDRFTNEVRKVLVQDGQITLIRRGEKTEVSAGLAPVQPRD